ncbi:hypothetical protein TKK_0018639 [Trichogramma kaykai]
MTNSNEFTAQQDHNLRKWTTVKNRQKRKRDGNGSGSPKQQFKRQSTISDYWLGSTPATKTRNSFSSLEDQNDEETADDDFSPVTAPIKKPSLIFVCKVMDW